MGDLYTALGVMLAIALGAGWGGIRLANQNARWIGNIGAIAAVLGLIAYAGWLIDDVLLAKILPVRNVMVWGNIQPIAAGVLAGIAWKRWPGAKWQRILFVTLLAGIGIWRACAPVMGNAPRLGPARWVNGICRQSTTSTCTAAAAATLLRAKGIDVSEEEMTKLCVTRVEGTSMLGLYRGLKIKTEGTGWDVEVVKGDMKELEKHLPAEISIGVQGIRRGWLGVGNRHSVVVLTKGADGKFEVGDPFAGRQWWTREQVARDWNGEGFWLKARE